MFWVFLLSIFGSIAVYVNRERHRELIPYVVATISTVQMFFLFLMVVHKNPFTTFLTAAPTDGEGLNPLLQNFYMAIHPPSLYTGFVGMTIPFAFGIAALVTGHLDDSWLRAVRRWTMFSWLFLSFGLTLGMIWAYEELGWGGYWGWDPVENAALLPWFTATAFLHSVMVQERRSMLRVWNVTLVIVTFFLTIFGTFMTRSGVVQSVHAFGEDPVLAWLFTGFMVVILIVQLRAGDLAAAAAAARNELDSWMSREAAFLVNNWILLFSALFVLFATMFPTLSEAVTGNAPHRRPAVLQQVDDADRPHPAVPDRRRSAARVAQVDALEHRAAVPVAGRGGSSRPRRWRSATRIPFWPSGLCFALCASSSARSCQEFCGRARSAAATPAPISSRRSSASSARNKRRYGGYIVHLGIVLIFLGFAGNGFKHDEQVLLKPGQQTHDRQVHAPERRREGDRRRPEADDHGVPRGLRGRQGDRQAVSGEVALPAARAGADDRGRDPPHARRGSVRRARRLRSRGRRRRRCRSSSTRSSTGSGSASASWRSAPASRCCRSASFAFALAKLPAEAAATTVALLFSCCCRAARRCRRSRAWAATPNTRTSFYARNAVREADAARDRLHLRACGHQTIAECRKDPCATSHEMRGELAALIDQKMDHDEIIQAFIAKYGSEEMLGAPLDKGFNRLAWLFPYLVGATSAVAVGFAAVKWTRHAGRRGRRARAARPGARRAPRR